MASYKTTDFEDTIAAICTAPGQAGIAVLRISGARAMEIGDRILRCKPRVSACNAGTFKYAHLLDLEEGKTLDEVIVLIFKAPHSYTCEDVIEVQSHGGRAVTARLLATALRAGARSANPGEFTQRAFLNGRIDLLQAEAVADLIQAQSQRAVTAATTQLQGALSKTINILYEETLQVQRDVTSILDFSDEEIPEEIVAAAPDRIEALIKKHRALIATRKEGILLREGVDVVITGKPNVGKSSLLNALLGRSRAIVSNTPGTTRDTIEESMILDGILISITDTAGLRNTTCTIEAEGIDRAKSRMHAAHVNIHLCDASRPLNAEEMSLIHALDSEKCLIVFNKKDLGVISLPALPHRCVTVSLLEEESATEVKDALRAIIEADTAIKKEPHAVISERHFSLLRNSLKELQAAKNVLLSNIDDWLLAANHLRDALEDLARLTGRNYHDELLDAIFSHFCLGK